MSKQYTDLRTLEDGTKFHVENGMWNGYIFSRSGIKYMHVIATGADIKLTGNERLIVTIIGKETT